MLSGVLSTRASLDLVRLNDSTITSQSRPLSKTHSKHDGWDPRGNITRDQDKNWARLSSIDSSIFVLGVYLALYTMMNSLEGDKSLQLELS